MTYGFLIFFIPLLLLEGFFAASEIALVSANRRRLHHRAEEGHRGARLALKILSKPEYLLATTLLGAYLSAAANTILVTAFLLKMLGRAGMVPAMIVLPPVILILGEIIPKSIGRQQAGLLAERLAPALWTASWLIYPITIVFASLSRVVLYLIGAPKTGHLPFITREDLSLVVTKSGPEVELEGKERVFIHRILQFSLRTVKEVMMPLVRVTAIPDTMTVAQALEEFRTTRFSRLPVYHRRIDNLIGVLHDFDLLGEEVSERPVKPFIRAHHLCAGTQKDRPPALGDAAPGHPPGGGGGRIRRGHGHCHHRRPAGRDRGGNHRRIRPGSLALSKNWAKAITWSTPAWKSRPSTKPCTWTCRPGIMRPWRDFSFPSWGTCPGEENICATAISSSRCARPRPGP